MYKKKKTENTQIKLQVVENYSVSQLSNCGQYFVDNLLSYDFTV